MVTSGHLQAPSAAQLVPGVVQGPVAAQVGLICTAMTVWSSFLPEGRDVCRIRAPSRDCTLQCPFHSPRVSASLLQRKLNAAW